jgi:NAD-dependent deacetylase
MNAIEAKQLAQWIHESKYMVALTGAGISTAAGLPDFRGKGGLYERPGYDPETIFDIRHFPKKPKPFFDFSRELIGMVGDLTPTFTHRLLARWEQEGKLHALLTQNIDPLHQMAGSKNVISLHGNYWNSHCLSCKQTYPYDLLVKMLLEQDVPRCQCGGLIKPDVVFFGEQVSEYEPALAKVKACDLLLVLGSSLVVYPVALLPAYAKGRVAVVNLGDVDMAPGKKTMVVNADLDSFFKLVDVELAALMVKGAMS